jgi:hypothetical protein
MIPEWAWEWIDSIVSTYEVYPFWTVFHWSVVMPVLFYCTLGFLKMISKSFWSDYYTEGE